MPSTLDSPNHRLAVALPHREAITAHLGSIRITLALQEGAALSVVLSQVANDLHHGFAVDLVIILDLAHQL